MNIQIKKQKRQILSTAINELLIKYKFKERSPIFLVKMEGGDGFFATINTNEIVSVIEFMINFNDRLKSANNYYKEN